MTTDRSSAGAEPAEVSDRPGAADEIDVKLLAEKVYRLLLADLRLAQARGGRAPRGRGRR